MAWSAIGSDPYTTMSFAAEAGIFRELGKFLLDGSLYRPTPSVLWSVVEKTALADAEVEYHDHSRTTIWVRFPLVGASRRGLAGAGAGDLDDHALDDPRQPRRGIRPRARATG